MQRAVNIVIRRRPRTTVLTTTTISIDARLLTFLVLFSLFTSAAGYSLGASAFSLRNAPRAGSARMDFEDAYDGWGVSSASLNVRQPERGNVVPTSQADTLGSLRQTASAAWWAPPSQPSVSSSGMPQEAQREKAERAGAVDAPPGPERIHTAEELQARLQLTDGLPTVLLFGAKHCRACRMLQPKLERVSKSSGARFLYVHHDKTTDALFAAHDVSQTPTAVVYDARGQEVRRQLVEASELKALGALLLSLHGARASEWATASSPSASPSRWGI